VAATYRKKGYRGANVLGGGVDAWTTAGYRITPPA